MTLEERKERFYNFHGCTATVCDDCVYHGGRGLCADRITEDARAILKDMADKQTEETIKKIVEENKAPVYKAPLTAEDRVRILETIRLKTEVPDLSAHFIQEINELCAVLNELAATIGKLEQLKKGTDPVGKDGCDEDYLVETIGVCVADVIEEATDVYNYLFVLGYKNEFSSFFNYREEKLARWANRLNGVSDE